MYAISGPKCLKTGVKNVIVYSIEQVSIYIYYDERSLNCT